MNPQEEVLVGVFAHPTENMVGECRRVGIDRKFVNERRREYELLDFLGVLTNPELLDDRTESVPESIIGPLCTSLRLVNAIDRPVILVVVEPRYGINSAGKERIRVETGSSHFRSDSCRNVRPLFNCVDTKVL